MNVPVNQHSIVKSAETVMSIALTLSWKYVLQDFDHLMFATDVKRLVSAH